MIGGDLHGAPEGGRGLLNVSEVTERRAEIVVRRGVVGVDVEGAAHRAQRLVEPANVKQDRAKVVVGFGVIGPECDGMAQRQFGFVRPRQFGEDGSKVVMGLCILGRQLDGAAQGGRRVLESLRLHQRPAKVVVDVGALRREGHGAFEEAERLVDVASLHQCDATQVERVHVLRLDTEHPAVTLERGLGTTRPMVRDRRFEDLRHRVLRPAAPGEGAEVLARLGVTGLDRQGAAQGGLGLIEPLEPGQSDPEIVMGFRGLRIALESRPQRFDRRLVGAGLDGRYPG